MRIYRFTERVFIMPKECSKADSFTPSCRDEFMGVENIMNFHKRHTQWAIAASLNHFIIVQ